MELTRKNFMAALAATAATGAVAADKPKTAKKPIPHFRTNAAGKYVFSGKPGDLRVKFLGTGAADWCRDKKYGPKADGEWRRRSSVLLDGRILIDFTDYAFDTLGDAKPDVIFYTHQHGDHYEAASAVKAGVRKAYVHRSWYEHARMQFEDSCKRQKKPQVEVIPLEFFQKVEFDGYTFTLLPANHSCDQPLWEPGVYAVRKGVTHLYYGTDCSYYSDRASNFYMAKEPPFTAIIQEATLSNKDTRITGHSSIDMDELMVESLFWRGYYLPPEGRKVYLTHLSRNSHPSHAEIAANCAEPLVPAYDGLEVVF